MAGGPRHAMLTDLANAQRFAREHNADLRFVHKQHRWLVWDGRRWAPDEMGDVKQRAKETVTRLYEEACRIEDSGDRQRQVKYAIAAQRAQRIAAMVDLATSEPGIAIRPDALDQDPWLMNVENGTLDLRTGRLRPHQREDLMTKLAPVCYDAAAECPSWEAFLDRVMDGNADLMAYVQKLLGYALTGDAREQCFFIFHGTGANGKSTLTTAVANAVGGYAMHTPTETLLVKRGDTIPNDVARLHGARLVTAAEAECNRQLAEALVKQLTGGDKMSARFLHGEWFEFTPTFKLVLSVNHKPVIKGTDHAIWRRVHLVPFYVTIPEGERDRTLPVRLEAERAGILRWMVEGCLKWQAEGLEPPQAVRDATAGYREEMDSVGAFLNECCIRDPDAKTATGRLYEEYRRWCDTQNEQRMNKSDFGARLAEKGFTPGRTGKSGRYWRGLALATQPVS